jgi:hypothetical protein
MGRMAKTVRMARTAMTERMAKTVRTAMTERMAKTVRMARTAMTERMAKTARMAMTERMARMERTGPKVKKARKEIKVTREILAMMVPMEIPESRRMDITENLSVKTGEDTAH